MHMRTHTRTPTFTRAHVNAQHILCAIEHLHCQCRAGTSVYRGLGKVGTGTNTHIMKNKKNTNIMFAIRVQHEACPVHLPLKPFPHIHTTCTTEEKDKEKQNLTVYPRAHESSKTINHADCQRRVGTSLLAQRRRPPGGAAGGGRRESSKTRRVSVVVLRSTFYEQLHSSVSR